MSDPVLSNLIREVLAEELGRLRSDGALGQAAVRDEVVSISTDADLQAFARRVLELSRDAETRRAIEKGKFPFRLAGGTAPARQNGSGTRHEDGDASCEVIERGFVSERQVDLLPKQTVRIVIGKAVRLSPLARDRLRQRGIAIERMD